MYLKQVLLLLLLSFFTSSCHSNKQEKEEAVPIISVDFAEIKDKGELTAVTLYSSTSYFQYKMQKMGYEYDLIKDFAKKEGLKLKIKVAKNTASLIKMLDNGEADVVAFPIPINNRLKPNVIYCGLASESSQVLI